MSLRLALELKLVLVLRGIKSSKLIQKFKIMVHL